MLKSLILKEYIQHEPIDILIWISVWGRGLIFLTGPGSPHPSQVLYIRTYIRGGVSKLVTNWSKTAVMDVIGFLCVSPGSITVQLHDSLGSRRACACSAAGFSSTNGDRVLQKSSALLCVFLWQKGSVQRIFIKKCFLFTVGTVCCVKRLATGWQMFRW
jgi:hypothetical protein